MSQEKLAKELGISVKTLQSYENGGTYPSLKLAIEISRILEVSLDYLFYDRNEQGILTDSAYKRYEELKQCFFMADERIVDFAMMFMDFLESQYNPENGAAAETQK